MYETVKEVQTHLPKHFNRKPAGRTTTGPTPEQAFSAEVMISVYRKGEQQ